MIKHNGSAIVNLNAEKAIKLGSYVAVSGWRINL